MAKGERRCVVCRRSGPKESFWRVVRIHPSHQIQLDMGMGRSAYLCPSEPCLRQAQRKNRLGRALKASIDEKIFETLGRRLVRIDKLQVSPEATPSELSGGSEDDGRKHTEQDQNL